MASGNSLVGENHRARFATPRLARTSLFLEGHGLWDQSLLVHVADERLERVPIALKPVWPEVLADKVHGLVGVLDEER
jgi:hypothetical protein